MSRLIEGSMVMLDGGPARVERVTECSATVRYVVGVERVFRPIGADHDVTIRTPGRTVTISPHSEVVLVCETPAESRARVAAQAQRDTNRKEYSLVQERLAAPLRGSNAGMAEMLTADMFDPLRCSLFSVSKRG